MNNIIADVVVDLQYGDCGKGKVTHHLLKTNNYTHCIRYNGSGNAGHTIYHDGVKYITHSIPAGIFYNIKSIIGPGCVLSVRQFIEELEELESKGIPAKSLVFVAENTHIITDEHYKEDQKDKKIGTTRRGNGPAYRDKYARKGVRAKDIPELTPYLIDIYKELHIDTKNPVILFEGAQGFGLDVDWGDYPYVTSSHCTVASAILNGIPPQSIRDIWGVAKIYETYVGAKQFHGKDPVFDKIREVGQEFGATTGRPRQCNWMNWQLIEKAININGINKLVFNKCDVLDNISTFALFNHNQKKNFFNLNMMQNWIRDNIPQNISLYFSRHKDKI